MSDEQKLDWCNECSKIGKIPFCPESEVNVCVLDAIKFSVLVNLFGLSLWAIHQSHRSRQISTLLADLKILIVN